jgi:hypothetical protein
MLGGFGIHGGNLLLVLFPMLHGHRVVSYVVVPNFNLLIVPEFVLLSFLLKVSTLLV